MSTCRYIVEDSIGAMADGIYLRLSTSPAVVGMWQLKWNFNDVVQVNRESVAWNSRFLDVHCLKHPCAIELNAYHLAIFGVMLISYPSFHRHWQPNFRPPILLHQARLDLASKRFFWMSCVGRTSPKRDAKKMGRTW